MEEIRFANKRRRIPKLRQTLSQITVHISPESQDDAASLRCKKVNRPEPRVMRFFAARRLHPRTRYYKISWAWAVALWPEPMAMAVAYGCGLSLWPWPWLVVVAQACGSGLGLWPWPEHMAQACGYSYFCYFCLFDF